MIAATAAANSGMEPLSMPVTDDGIHCSAIGKIVIGRAIHSSPTSAIRGRSSTSIRPRRAPGRAARASQPNTTRPRVIVPGASDSRPSAMSRNEAPQMAEATSSSVQSNGAKAAALAPSEVERRRRAAGGRSAVDVTRPTYERSGWRRSGYRSPSQVERKPISLCVPSQSGLFFEPPQRQG